MSWTRIAVLVTATIAAVALVAKALVPRNATLEALFRAAGGRYGVDPALLHAIAWQESNLDPNAISPANTNRTRDYGLMQINEVNFSALGLTVQTALNPAVSVEAAAKLIAGFPASVRANVADTLSVYNAGSRNGVPRRGDDGRYINANYVTSAYGRYLFAKVVT